MQFAWVVGETGLRLESCRYAELSGDYFGCKLAKATTEKTVQPVSAVTTPLGRTAADFGGRREKRSDAPHRRSDFGSYVQQKVAKTLVILLKQFQ